MESYEHQQLLIRKRSGESILCLPGRVLVGNSDEYVLIRNDLRGLSFRDLYCDTSNAIKDKLEFILLLPKGDSIDIIRNLDSLEVIRRFPFVDFDLL